MELKFKIATAADLAECLDWKPKIIETKLGPIEYAERGEGPVLLSVHGGPGGYDQGLGLGEVFSKSGFRVIAPSRAGYLGTPVDNGSTFEAQADMHAALLGALNIDKAVVIAVSAGGPSTYTLAQRYPQKVAALVAIDAVCTKYTKLQEVSKTAEYLFMSKPGLWLVDFFMKYFPSSIVNEFFKTESTLDKEEIKTRIMEVVKDEDKFGLLKLLMSTMTKRYHDRRAGLEIDIEILNKIDKIPLDNITCPTLIIHGKSDGDVKPEQAEYAHSLIKQSEIMWIEKGSHIGFWIAEDAYNIQKKTIDWLAAL